MGFSTFRLMLGANQSSGPAVLTDTVYPEAGILIYNATLGTGGTPLNAENAFQTCIDSSASQYRLLSTDADSSSSGSAYSWVPATQTAGPSLSLTTTSLGGGTPTNKCVANCNTSLTGSMIAFNNTDTNIVIKFLNGSNTQVASNSASFAAVVIKSIKVAGGFNSGSGGLVGFFVAMADGTSQIFAIDNVSVYAMAAGPADVSKNAQFINLTTTLGVIIYANGSNLIKYATVNNAVTTMTADAAVSSGITAASGAKICPIDASHFLMVYKKSANTLAARTVTVATGSSFTLNTEYTCVCNTITDDPIGTVGQFSSGGDYGVTYINGNGQGCVVLMSVSGTTVTFNTPSIYHTANNVVASSDYYSSDFLGNPADSSKTLVSYMIAGNFLANPYNYVRSIQMDLNWSPSSHLWATSWTGNIQVTQNLNITGGANIDEVSLGTDRVFTVSLDNSTSLYLYTRDLTYNQGFNNKTLIYTAEGTTNSCAVANIGYSSTTSNVQRVLVAYGYGTTVRAMVVSVAQDGSITANTSAVVDTGVRTVGPYTVNCINYTTDKTLVVTQHSDGIYASIVTTSGTTISSATAPFKIYSNTLTTDWYAGSCVLDSSHIMLIVNTSGTLSNYPCFIINISGTTITAGTVVNIGTNVTSEGGNPDICQLAAGRGLITYVDHISASDKYQAVGFTWSGTTITVGTSIVTIGNAQGDHTNQTHCIALNSTEAMIAVHGTNSLYLLTSSGINSISVGTSYPTTGGLYGFVKQENYNKLIFRIYTGLYYFGMAYRV